MTASADRVPVLAAHGITKRFPGVLANEAVDFELNQGEIHCLLGENGAGKSTLVNILFGLYQPDEGELAVRGERVRFTSSSDAIAHGIGMVHQHFQLIPVLTVAENIVLGAEPRSGLRLDLHSARVRVEELSRQYGLEIDPGEKVENLSVGEQQRVELIKALYRDAEILIIDEPTAVLTPGEVDEFFDVVRSLVAQGKSIVFITHKLREVIAVADRITVMRDGRVVGSADPESATPQSLATLMVGRDVILQIDKQPASPGNVRLSVSGLEVLDDRGSTTVSKFDLEVRGGEIFGIAGVEGNGQRELVEALTGMRPPVGGHVEIDGVDSTMGTPRAISAHGVGHVPEDRNKHGLIGAFTVADNLVLNSYHRKPFARGFVRQQRAVEDQAVDLVERYDIRTPGILIPAEHLSGGNQQKVIIARELSRELRVLVVAQPTRGLDVGSIEFIHRRIVEIRDQGVAVLLVSAELDEVLSLSDRIGVLYRGQLVGQFDRAQASRDEIGLLMACGTTEPQAATG